MRITKELFMKLSKKDREEYSSKIKEVKKDIQILPYFFQGINIIGYWAIIAMIVLPLWKLAFPNDLFASMVLLILSIFKILFMLLFLFLASDAVILFIKVLNLRKIREEYFKTEIKVNGDK